MKPLAGEVWKVKLYPTRGSEQDGVRPCLVISPNSMNKALPIVLAIPMTRQIKQWPTRVNLNFKKEQGQVCIEHIRSISKDRLIEKLGKIKTEELTIIRKRLRQVFED